MKSTSQHWLACAALALLSTTAQAAPPSEASIEELLVLSRAEAVMENILKSMEDGMKRAIAGSPPVSSRTPEQQRLINELPAKFGQLMRAELNWAVLRDVSVQTYQETFDQSEVDGFIAFYKSPAGRSFVQKMPLAMQKSNLMMQERLKQIMPKVQATMAQLKAEIDAAK